MVQKESSAEAVRFESERTKLARERLNRSLTQKQVAYWAAFRSPVTGDSSAVRTRTLGPKQPPDAKIIRSRGPAE